MKKQILTFILMLSVATCFAQTRREYTSLEEALINPNQVYKLNLSDQDLTEFPKEILQFKNLESLYLMDNQLTHLPAEISELQSLRALLLVRNQFTAFPEEICALKNLEYLYLSDNQIQTLPTEISELQKLQFLELNDNQIQTLPIEFGSLQSLKILGLEHNQFSSFPVAITQFPGLETLNLNNNQLEDLPPEIGQLQSLDWLKLDNNQLEDLPPEIGQLQKLKWLELDNNQLIALPPEIGQLQNLERLGLSNNQLSNLLPTITELQNLEELYVDGNNISAVEQETLKQRLPNCNIIFWEKGIQLLEKKEWVQVSSNANKNRGLIFSVQFEKDTLRLRKDLLSKGKYKRNLYELELMADYSHSTYKMGFFSLKENDEKYGRYFIVSEDEIYLKMGAIYEDNEMKFYLPYYSKSKFEALNQLPPKENMLEEEFLQFLDEVILILKAGDFIFPTFAFDELNFSSATSLIQQAFAKQGYNPFSSLKAYNKAYKKYKNQALAKAKIKIITDFFEY